MPPTAHLTSHSGMSACRWETYSCHLFLISSASVRSLPFLPFTVPILAWSIPLISPVFLKRSLVFLFSSVSLHVHLKRPSYLSLLFSGTLHPLGIFSLFLSFLLLCFPQQFVKPPQTLDFLNFFFLGMVLVTNSYSMSQTSFHNFSCTLSTRSNPLSALYNHKGFDLCHTDGWQQTALSYSFLSLETISCSIQDSSCCSCPAYRFFRRQIKWSGIPISLRTFQSLLLSTLSKALA